MNLTSSSLPFLLVGVIAGAAQAQTTFSTFGADAAAIQATVDSFRAAIGATNNGSAVGSQGTGRREINWDGAPDGDAAPGRFPGDFFNAVAPRGAIVVNDSGSGQFQVSADSSNPSTTAIEFDNVNLTYSTAFATFSNERLFADLTSTIYDVHFFIPGSLSPAAVRGFGAVFVDVDSSSSSSLEFFRGKESLGVFMVEPFAGDGGLSFLGVDFEENVVTRVRITAGDAVLGSDDVTQTPANLDVVVLDDFIYGEPNEPVPSFDGVAGGFGALVAEVADLGLSNKLDKKLAQPLDAALKDANKAVTQNAASKDKQARNKLKSALAHLRQFEKLLDTNDAVSEVDAETRLDLAGCAAAIGVDIASLIATE